MEDSKNGYGFLNVYCGVDTKYTCTELHRNTNYKFRICAHNEDGKSPFSEAPTYRTLADRPKPPSPPSIKGKPYPTKLILMWTPPHDDGGSSVTNFKVEIEKGSNYEGVYDGPNTECECTDLTPGTNYRVRACASNSGGCSDWSASSLLTTEPVCPGQCRPPQLLTKPKASLLQLRWGK